MDNLTTPTILTSLIDYQNNAVVSSTLIKKNNGTITLFAFDQEQALSQHTAPYEALVQVLDGQLEISVGGEPHKLNASEALLLPAGIPHSVRAIEASKILLTMIKSEDG